MTNLRRMRVKPDPNDHGYGNDTPPDDERPAAKKPLVIDPWSRPCAVCGARKGKPCKWVVLARTVGKKSKLGNVSRIVHATRLEGTTDA